jgi:hypothetical protein
MSTVLRPEMTSRVLEIATNFFQLRRGGSVREGEVPDQCPLGALSITALKHGPLFPLYDERVS